MSNLPNRLDLCTACDVTRLSHCRRYIDSHGRAIFMCWPLLIYSAICLVETLAPSFVILTLLRIVAAFCMSPMAIAAHASYRDVTPGVSGRALSYSFLGTAFTLGSMLASFIPAHSLSALPGWRPQFLIGAGLGASAGLCVFCLLRDVPPHLRNQKLTESGSPPPAYTRGATSCVQTLAS